MHNVVHTAEASRRPSTRAHLPGVPNTFPEMDRLSLDELENLAHLDNIQE